MAWSPEAIIAVVGVLVAVVGVLVAVVGVLINVPTFCLGFWRMCRNRDNNNNNSTRSLEDRDSDIPLIPPRRYILDIEYALALPYAVPLVNLAQRPGRQ
ncbi:hypothetical protein ACHAPT_003936 [Fusarium lateritium]